MSFAAVFAHRVELVPGDIKKDPNRDSDFTARFDCLPRGVQFSDEFVRVMVTDLDSREAGMLVTCNQVSRLQYSEVHMTCRC